MFRGKYIVFERGGLEYPVLFPNHFVQHKEVQTCDKLVSAGFFAIDGEDVFVSGQSISLKLSSRKEDADLIKKQLSQ
jgi:hypothetical protein